MLPEQLTQDALAVEAALMRRFDAMRKEAAPRQGADPRLVDAMSYAVMAGGKRLRAGLVLGAARLSAGHQPEGAIQVAEAFEALHAYSLIHDDLPAMDDAETRRGKPACHIEFDEATAILAGDALQTLAFELLADPLSHPDGNTRAELVLELAKASGAAGMAGGQMLDLEAETRAFSLEETRLMQSMKTGALIRAAAVAGGRVGNADDAMLKALHHFADNLGLAFQIADDILDRNSDAEAMGKPTGRDDDAGKASFVSLMGIDAATKEAERLVAEAGEVLTDAAGSSGQNLDYLLKISSFIVRRDH